MHTHQCIEQDFLRIFPILVYLSFSFDLEENTCSVLIQFDPCPSILKTIYHKEASFIIKGNREKAKWLLLDVFFFFDVLIYTMQPKCVCVCLCLFRQRLFARK